MGFCITDQITDQYAPYCSELGDAVSNDYIELADHWWMQQEMNTLSLCHYTYIVCCFILIIVKNKISTHHPTHHKASDQNRPCGVSASCDHY
jgi:hypothetical protein